MPEAGVGTEGSKSSSAARARGSDSSNSRPSKEDLPTPAPPVTSTLRPRSGESSSSHAVSSPSTAARPVKYDAVPVVTSLPRPRGSK